MVTDFTCLKKLRIPSDVTDDQIYELFDLAGRLSLACISTNCRKKSIQRKQDALVTWFLLQNFHQQIENKVNPSL